MPTWLELLPDELFGRVAVHVARAQKAERLVNLARAYPKRRDATLGAIAHSMAIELDVPMKETCEMISLFAPVIKELILFCSYNDLFDHLRFVLPQCSTLLRYSSTFDLELAKGLSQCRSLLDLTLHICSESIRGLLFMTLGKLNVQKLHLSCDVFHPTLNLDHPHYPLCLFDDTRFFRSDFNALTLACRKLTTLQVSCQSCTPTGALGGFRFLNGLMELDQLYVCGDIPVDARPKLPRSTDIVLALIRDVDGALSLGRSLTGLHSMMLLSEHQVRKLSRCCHLTSLRIGIQCDAEWLLPLALASVSYLEDLHLTWAELTVPQGEIRYEESDRGLLPRAIRAMPNLRRLGLTCVRIARCDVMEILRIIGAYLEELVVDVTQQEQPPRERLLDIMIMLAKCNQNIVKFEPLDAYESSLECHSVTDFREIEQTYLLLQRRAPSMMSMSMDALLRFSQYSKCSL